MVQVMELGTVARVSLGAALLDTELPQWWTEIDTETLDMNNPDNCVLGQLYGTYMSGLATLKLIRWEDLDVDWKATIPIADAHGFIGRDEEDDKWLALAWIAAVVTRLQLTEKVTV